MNTPESTFRFGPFRFDSAQQELRRRTLRLHLSVSLLKLLTLFLTRRGELITREEIALTLWEDSSTVDIVTGINTAVRRLRAQLADDPTAPAYIETKMEIVAQLPNRAAMAEFSPDGKWILFAEFAGSPSHAIGIFSVPSSGGKPRQLYTTGAIDEFHCPTSSTGSCVMRETNGNKEFLFLALDPVHGMQQEVGRIPWEPTVLGDWSVSPDGSTVAMANHDPESPGIQLIHLSSHRSILPSTIPVLGFGEVRGATWLPDAKGFFVETKTMTGYNLLYVDQAGHAKLLRHNPIAIWGIPSRDGKKLAFPSVASNVWAGRTLLP